MVCTCHRRLLQFVGIVRIKNPRCMFAVINSANSDVQTRKMSTEAPTNSTDADFVNKIKRKETRGLPIIHHNKYVSELPLNHRFAMRKFHGVLRFLRMDGIISMNQVVEPEKISAELTSLVHDSEYVDKFFNGQTTPQEQRMTGFPWSEGLVDRCLYETGGTLLACHLAKEHGLACSTAGGTHHAYPGYGSGYCLINDMGVAAAAMLQTGGVGKVLIVDLDVHQGDGTAAMFEDDPRVFTLSMHCQNNFPSVKQTSDLDIGLCKGMEDREYLQLLEGHLPWVVDSFRPDIVIYDAGVDPHVKDELGKLCLTDQGLYDRDLYVLTLMANRNIPCATVIGGGYSRHLNALYRRHTIVHRAATKIVSVDKAIKQGAHTRRVFHEIRKEAS